MGEEYKVVLERQIYDVDHRPRWKTLCLEYHRIAASDAETAIVKAKALEGWVNRQMPSRSERVKLQAICYHNECIWSA